MLYIIIIVSVFFCISELLPFVKRFKSNGLIECVINFFKPLVIEDVTEYETEPLLTEPSVTINIEPDVINKLEILTDKLTDKLDKYNFPIFNKNITLLNENIINSRHIKLQQSSMYELNYIINFIKSNYPKKSYSAKFLSKNNKQLLISEGYTVDYDSIADMHIIKW